MILCLAGTSDARELAIEMMKDGYDVLTTVVTDNAAAELKRQGLQVRTGRLTSKEFAELITLHHVQAVVDASHPFAEEASKNAIEAARQAGVPYVRYERESQTFESSGLTMVDSYEAAADLAAEHKGVIMLTTGSKTLQIFSKKLLHLPDTRVLARMLPRKDNMEKCEELGFPQKNIIAIQGPFSKEFDEALYKQYGVTLMITKESGKAGSVEEKIEAAKKLGIDTIIIKRPSIEYGTKFSSFQEVINALRVNNPGKRSERVDFS
jgi:precorrin-6A/cobalt-precorrin-6A reductase